MFRTSLLAAAFTVGCLSAAEAANGAARRDALIALATQVRGYMNGSTDPQRVQWLSTSISDLAKAN